MRLSYIEANDAIRAANEIFGFGSWSTEVKALEHIGTEEATNSSGRKGVRVSYRAVVRLTVMGPDALYGVVYEDVGFGDAVEYAGSSLTPHELAAKEAVSDAIKRCLKNLGDQFGLGLYSEEGRAQVAAERERRVSAKDPLKQAKAEALELVTAKLGRAPVGRDEIAATLGIDAPALDDLTALTAAIEAAS